MLPECCFSRSSMDRAVCLVCRVRPVVVVRWVLNERSHRCIEWMLPWLSRNSSRFMNENQVFALHFIQISVWLLLQSSLEISVFTFYVFNHSLLAAHGALVTTLLQGGHLLILRRILCRTRVLCNLTSLLNQSSRTLQVSFKVWLIDRTLISPILHGLRRPSRWSWCHSMMTLLAPRKAANPNVMHSINKSSLL